MALEYRSTDTPDTYVDDYWYVKSKVANGSSEEKMFAIETTKLFQVVKQEFNNYGIEVKYIVSMHNLYWIWMKKDKNILYIEYCVCWMIDTFNKVD